MTKSHFLLDHWWIFLITGVLAIIFGIFLVSMPAISLTYLLVFFTFYIFLDGVLSFLNMYKASQSGGSWLWFLIKGIFQVVIAFWILSWPGISALILLYVIAFWIIAKGFINIVIAIDFKEVISDSWLLTLSGVVAIIFGLFMVARPGWGVLAFAIYLGIYAIFYGIMQIILSYALKGLKSR